MVRVREFHNVRPEFLKDQEFREVLQEYWDKGEEFY